MCRMDSFSYHCGAIDAFCEMVSAGVKALAFSHPLDSRAELAVLLPFAEETAARYGVKCYVEETPMVTDLFPLSAMDGKTLLLLYREDHTLAQYLRLKERKAALAAERAYFGGNRARIARELGLLLSYGEETVERLLEENGDRELACV